MKQDYTILLDSLMQLAINMVVGCNILHFVH